MQFKKLDSQYFLHSSVGNSSLWSSYSNGVVSKLEAAVSALHFSKSKPFYFAVSNGFQVQIRDPCADNAIVKSLTRFKERVSCLSYRRDGALVGVGDEAGVIRIFDTKSKTNLRSFKSGHSGTQISSLKFLDTKNKFASCAEDGKAIVWDLGEGKQITEYIASTDEHAKQLEASQTNCNLFIVGGGDGKVLIFDIRQANPINTLDHGFSVTALKLTNSDNLLFTAGDCWVKVWSLRESGRPIAAFKRHHKHVTALALTNKNPALFSCGLDGLVKVTDLQTYEEAYKFEYPNSPLLSMDISKDDKYILLGSADKWLQTRHIRLPTDTSIENMSDKQILDEKVKRNPYLKAIKADKILPARKEDVTPDVPAKVRFSKIDKMLKVFRHSEALTYVLKENMPKTKPADTVAVFQELIRRGALRTALAGRRQTEVKHLLGFCVVNILKPRFTLPLIAVADILCDLYIADSSESPQLRKIFLRLRGLCTAEAAFLQQARLTSSKITLLTDSSGPSVL